VNSYATAYEKAVRAAESLSAGGRLENDLPATYGELDQLLARERSAWARDRKRDGELTTRQARKVIDELAAKQAQRRRQAAEVKARGLFEKIEAALGPAASVVRPLLVPEALVADEEEARVARP
jgi:polyhydroxyalkanoate synthesis regulator phasin